MYNFNEKYIIDMFVINAKTYNDTDSIIALKQCEYYTKKLQRLKGFDTFEEAFKYLENNL